MHRLVMLVFCGKSDLCVHHKDGDKTNNRMENLSYVTYSENEQHSWAGGKRPAYSGAKITETDAFIIRNRRAAGERAVDLAKEFGLSPQTICDIHKRRIWTDHIRGVGIDDREKGGEKGGTDE